MYYSIRSSEESSVITDPIGCQGCRHLASNPLLADDWVQDR